MCELVFQFEFGFQRAVFYESKAGYTAHASRPPAYSKKKKRMTPNSIPLSGGMALSGGME